MRSAFRMCAIRCLEGRTKPATAQRSSDNPSSPARENRITGQSRRAMPTTHRRRRQGTKLCTCPEPVEARGERLLSDHPFCFQRAQVRGGQSQQVAVNLGIVLTQAGAQRVDAAGRLGEARHHVRHGEVAHARVPDAGDVPARDIVLVLEGSSIAATMPQGTSASSQSRTASCCVCFSPRPATRPSTAARCFSRSAMVP